jgi:hypothetical protein
MTSSTAVQSLKVLVDDTTEALNRNDSKTALIHLNLIKQQLMFSVGILVLSK